MITDLSETVGMIHTLVQNTTHHNNLKSSRGGGSQAQPSLFEDLHLLATSMEIMTNNLDMIPTFINEAHEWRYMTTDAYTKFKSVMTSL
jgi:hypothetical protein